AIVLYRQVLEKERNHGLALNNLAWLLALAEKQPAAALELIQRAEQRYGPVPELVDTRSVFEVLLGQGQQAVRDLEEVVADAPTATHYFHLAQAQVAAGNRKAAEAAWEKANSLGLKAGDLHPLEQPGYNKLRGELNRSAPAGK